MQSPEIPVQAWCVQNVGPDTTFGLSYTIPSASTSLENKQIKGYSNAKLSVAPKDLRYDVTVGWDGKHKEVSAGLFVPRSDS